jgi:hypothetical protein
MNKHLLKTALLLTLTGAAYQTYAQEEAPGDNKTGVAGKTYTQQISTLATKPAVKKAFQTIAAANPARPHVAYRNTGTAL